MQSQYGNVGSLLQTSRRLAGSVDQKTTLTLALVAPRLRSAGVP